VISAAELIGLVTIKGAEQGALQLARVGESADSAGAKLAGLAVGGTVLAGAALVGIGIAATKMAADFQQGVNRLRTGGGDIQDSFNSLWTGIQKVAVATGELTGQLTPAMYLIVSAGQRGAQAFATLTAAAQGAQIEQAKVADVTQILTTLQTDFGIKTYTAAQYMDGLVSAVSHGKITLEDLSTAMSPILPMAGQLGIHFADVSAAMADMTNQGIPAAQAATSLRFVFQSMILPTKASQTAMKEWGLDTGKVAEEMKVSLPGALQMYIDAAKRAGPEGSKPFIDALSTMMGGGQRAAKALFALDQSMNTWRGDIKAVNTAMGDTSKNVAGWDTAQSNLNVKLQQGQAALQVLGQNVGAVLLPSVSQLLDKMIPLIGQFDDWFVKSGREATVLSAISTGLSTLTSVAGTTAGVIGNIAGAFQDAGATGIVLRSALIALGIAFAAVKLTEFMNGIIGTIGFLKDLIPVLFATEAATLGLVGVFGLVVAAIFAAGYVAMNWDRIMGALQTTVLQSAGALGLGFSALGTAVHKAFDVAGSAASTFAGAYQGNGTDIGNISKRIGDAFSGLGTLTHQVWGVTIAGSVQSASASVQQSVANMQSGVSEHITEMTNTASQRAEQMRRAVANSAQGMYNAAADAASNMAAHVVGSALNMEQQVVRDFSVTESTASSLVQQLHDNVIGDFQSMDSLAKGYWDDVANYILDHPIEGSVNINVGGANAGSSATVHHYASGTNYAPGGASLVGEGGQAELVVGPHLMNLPTGAGVYPLSQVGGGGGGASGQPVQVNIYLAGQRVESVLLPGLVTAIRNATGAKF